MQKVSERWARLRCPGQEETKDATVSFHSHIAFHLSFIVDLSILLMVLNFAATRHQHFTYVLLAIIANGNTS